MKSRMKHSITVLATGFVVLLLLSLPLFWARWFCDITLGEIMPHDFRYVRIRPSGLVPPELENDPNVVHHSEVQAWMRTIEPQFFVLGIVDYFSARGLEGRQSNIYYYHKKDDGDEDWVYFNEKTGQIVCHYTQQERRIPDNTLIVRQVQLYAGPEGVSETPDKKLGRFIRPIVDRRLWDWRSSLILYDKKQRRFYKINFKEKNVLKAAQLSKDDYHKPIQIGLLMKNPHFLPLRWEPPMIKASREEALKKGHLRKWGDDYIIPIIERDYYPRMGLWLPVLDATGRIDLLDGGTLEYVGSAGYLPAPETLYPSKKSVTPKDLLAYHVRPLNLSPFRPESDYRGIFTACVNREGTGMTMAVFDKEGQLIRTGYTRYSEDSRYRETTPSSKAVFFEVPWAPTLTIVKSLLENLHPPILSIASYAMADSIEATAGHRALFILPNSFIAMKGRDVSKNTTEKFFTALMLIFPSIILSILLAWRVSIDATVLGLSENARVFWILATIAFGLAGYITYRLTRPEITQVSCANCGRLRRPDMDRCHRCGSKWLVPELTPPTWRVIENV